jgi:hypothetical protein
VVLVTGSSLWNHLEPVQEALAGAEKLIVGDAEGADELALQTAWAWDIIPAVFDADWDGLGKGAGPARNTRMVAAALRDSLDGFDVRCHAFPLEDSIGTWDCVRKLQIAGFPVTLHRP